MKDFNKFPALFILKFKFSDKVKAIVLFFDRLTDEELKAIKPWIKNTTEEKLAQKDTEVLDSDKKEFISMVASKIE
ncbi:hypothetical protein [Clostridium uliginosum]|uniref:Uncharacterized protein n=1 Tax=Clostridium uliginosum TaxID=119641 RepID=A0A1I1P5G1_9CLOT|nr:hypothetical protein [Clostridium uliginosum]SFD02233.1 hypothetical protein SAMN05421842_11736 [Clostridium uliginosum]